MTTTEQEPDEAEIVHTTEIVPAPPPPALFKTDDPVEVIEKATAVADALKDVLRKQGLVSTISGRSFVKVEGWTLLGSMLGVNAVCTGTETLPEGGYRATVEARMADGRVVGSADAACTRTEKTWKNRDDYALLSMAQTRATSKALRIPLGFVVTLAGFEATPADEIPGPDASAMAEPASNAPFGPAATGNTIARTKNAITYLLDGDKDASARVLGALLERVAQEGKAGDYLPMISARTIGLIATELKKKREVLEHAPVENVTEGFSQCICGWRGKPDELEVHIVAETT